MNEQSVDVDLTVNGMSYRAAVPPRWTLADFLRRTCGLTGTHLGCEHGVCGACTVLVDGASARSCCLLAAQVNGCEVITVEGIGTPEALHPLQESFHRNLGLQCGFCTPGMLMTAVELLADESADLSEDLVRERMSGNLCRCTGYQAIVRSVIEAAAGSGPES